MAVDVPKAALARLSTDESVMTAVSALYVHKLPDVAVEGTGRSVAVLIQAGGWSVANRHNTARFPKLRLEIHSDSTPGAYDAESRAHDAWEPFDKILHNPAGIDERWGELRVINCVRLTDPELYPVTGKFRLALLVCDYAVTIG